jgi:hypothetical protein
MDLSGRMVGVGSVDGSCVRVNASAGLLVEVATLNNSSATGSVDEDEDIYAVYRRHMRFRCAWGVDGCEDCAGLAGD